MKTIEVVNCANCPFKKWDMEIYEWYCGATKKEESIHVSAYASLPEFCPLRTDDIMITLKPKQ